MPDLDCVSEHDLRAFLLGDLPARVANLVADHLSGCWKCEAAARRFDDLTDPVVRTLRRALGGEESRSTMGHATPAPDRTEPSAADPAPLPRHGPPGYELLGELGRGGMCVVYHARQTHPRRIVALKMILAAAHAGSSRKARFLAEADAIARLRHPNIVGVYEVGEHGGLPYLSLEYIAGGTLAARLAGTPLPPPTAAALVETLAGAVHYAHEQGVVHRDLKPENILLEAGSDKAHGGHWSQGTVAKITDFGLAKQAELTLTATGDILGTPQYMAPEQADGTRSVGPAADIYALGVILYECLIGRPPFRGASALETMNQVRSLPPMPPRDLQPRIPRDLETICLKCLEKEPDRRYLRAADLADDLRRFRAGESIQGRRAGQAERAWRWCRRNPVMAGLTASVGTLLLVIAVGAILAAVRLNTALSESEGQRRRAEGAEAGRTEELFHAYVNQARSKRLSGTVGRRFDALEAIGKAAGLARELAKPPHVIRELRAEAIAALALPDLHRERTGRLPPGVGIAAADVWGRFAQDLTRHVAVQNGTVVVYGADDQPSRSLTGPRPAIYALISPDGRHVVASLGGERRETALWDLDDPRPEPKVVLAGVFTRTAFRRDGRVFALWTDHGAMLYDVAGGPPVGPIGHAAYWSLAPDPTGRRLAATDRSSGGAAVRVFDLATGAEELTWAVPKGVIAEVPAWNDDGTLLAVGIGRAIHVWAFGEGPPREVAVLERHQNASVFCQFVPGTGLLLSSAWDGMTRLWDPVGGRQLLSISGTIAAVGADGRVALLDSAGGYAVWRLDPAAECRLLHHSRGPDPAEQNLRVLNPTFAPDGRLLATGCGDGVRVWDAATGLVVGPLLRAGHSSLLFLPGSGDLVTYPVTGPALRWPRTEHNGATAFGPPRWLADGPHDAEALPTATPDGAWLAYAAGDYPQVVNTADPTHCFVLEAHGRLRSLSLSPDGRSLATGTWQGRDLLVREVATGRKLHRIEGNSVRGWFSPDGRRLATSDYPGKLGRLWDVTFAPASELESFGTFNGAFSNDSQRLAVSNGPGIVRLIDPADGRPLADLELPAPAAAMNMAFNPAGDKLAVATMDQFAAVWDLAAVRRTLGRMGLDWEDTPPPAPPAPAGPPPRVEFVGADLAADAAAFRQAERDRLGLALWANPFDAMAYFERGRLLLADNQPAAAYDHFSAALALRPDRPAVRNARLAAAIRLERWIDALADADALDGHWPDKPGLQNLRAEALHELGRHSEAADAVGKAMAVHPNDAEMYLFRAECYAALDRRADAAADRNRAGELAATDPGRFNDQAWRLVTGPPGWWEPRRAVRLARLAVRLRPDDPLVENTLGVALYRARKEAEAVPVLEQCMARSAGRNDGWNLFVLAMCRHRLGQAARAKVDLARAEEWMDRQTGLSETDRQQLSDFRSEAENLLRPAK